MLTELYHSPLFENISKYFQNNPDGGILYIFAPYIKTDIIARLLEGLPGRAVIITSWTPANIQNGSSELTLYPYCMEHGHTLYVNERIHLKIYSVGLADAIISSGNVSVRGLMPGGNHEIGVRVTMTNKDRLFLEILRAESRIVNRHMYEKMKEWADANPVQPYKTTSLDDIVPDQNNDNFLVSALPMTRSIDELVLGYAEIGLNRVPSNDPEVSACVFHDLANYDILPGLSENKFRQQLSERFFAHPFIQKIDELIAPKAHFGEIKEWVQTNCTDVPVPSRRELTGNVQVLLKWFVALGDGNYVVDVPGARSERIRRMR